jgi:hypothetical protein
MNPMTKRIRILIVPMTRFWRRRKWFIERLASDADLYALEPICLSGSGKTRLSKQREFTMEQPGIRVT